MLFLCLVYVDVMEWFGFDKLDLRFDMELIDISDIVVESEFGVFRSVVVFGGCVCGVVVLSVVEHYSRRIIE